MKNKEKKDSFFERILNRILKLKFLKRFKLAVGFIKGFEVEVEFFESKGEKNNE